jgi:hypothetical protein
MSTSLPTNRRAKPTNHPTEPNQQTNRNIQTNNQPTNQTKNQPTNQQNQDQPTKPKDLSTSQQNRTNRLTIPQKIKLINKQNHAKPPANQKQFNATKTQPTQTHKLICLPTNNSVTQPVNS